MGDDKVRPFRYTRGKLSWELSFLVMFFIWGWRAFTWGWRRTKPIFYHPYGMLGLIVAVWAYVISPWFLLSLLGCVYTWATVFPDSYLKHAQPRLDSFKAGWYYRHRPRRKLTTCGLLNQEDPVPTISRVSKVGCTTQVRIKMSHGDSIGFWRKEERGDRIAQTYNALDCKINPYRRETLVPWRHELITKPRWVQLEFLTKDPFIKTLGVEYINFHRNGHPLPEEGNPVGPMRDGSPYRISVRTHLLVMSQTGGGKTNAEACMVYTEHPAVMAGLVENWGFDGKKGTGLAIMEKQFAHHCYVDKGPGEAVSFFRAAEAVMNRRLLDMREENINEFEPTTNERALRIYIDEFNIFESVVYGQPGANNTSFRTQIYSSIAAILQQGRAAGVSIIAFAQDPKKERMPLRDGFPERQIGRMNRAQVDMALPGGWDRGAKADEIPWDLPGVFYVETDAGMAPEAIRYAHVTNEQIQALPACPPSALWPIKEHEGSAQDRLGAFA